MQLPGPVYETLPMLYVLVGIAVAITHPEPMPFGSGILLASGGLIILVRRRRHRARQRRRLRRQWAANTPGA